MRLDAHKSTYRSYGYVVLEWLLALHIAQDCGGDDEWARIQILDANLFQSKLKRILKKAGAATRNTVIGLVGQETQN